MNIFLLSPDIKESCQELAELDPVRARKQLVECCQLLASVDHIIEGSTDMLRADGLPYKMVHPHHPITKHMCISDANHTLCHAVAYWLSLIYDAHACCKSLRNWTFSNDFHFKSNTYCVVRLHHDTVYVNTLTEYSDLMRPYVMAKIAVNKEKVK